MYVIVFSVLIIWIIVVVLLSIYYREKYKCPIKDCQFNSLI